MIALLLALSTLAPAHPARAQQPDSLPGLSSPPNCSARFDPVFRVAGLEPLCKVRLPGGEREVRIWIQVAIAIPGRVYRFVDRGGRVTGELIYHWPVTPPDTSNGWTIVVELRDANRYRRYTYYTPESHRKWPSAAKVTDVADALGAIDSLVAPSEVNRVYRGVTTGRYQSAFRSCESGDEWEFHADLRSLAQNSPPSVRATLPDSAVDTTATGSPLFYVEVIAQLTPEWVARDWGSSFPRALDVIEVRDVRPWTGVECGTR